MSSKLSKREHTIRIGGILMLASPLLNIFVSVFLSTGVPNKWGPSGLKLILANVPTVNWILYASSILIGAMMMKGRRSSWAFVLVVLAGYLVCNALTIYQDIKAGNVHPILAMLVNCGLFVLVYMQEFHQQVYGFVEDNVKMPAMPTLPSMPSMPVMPKLPTLPTFPTLPSLPNISPRITAPPQKPVLEEKAETPFNPVLTPSLGLPVTPTPLFERTDSVPAARPAPVFTERTVSLCLPLDVDFTGQGTWAKLISISATELRMKRISQTLPDGLHYRTVELVLPSYPEKITIQARLFSNNGSEYIFKVVQAYSLVKAA